MNRALLLAMALLPIAGTVLQAQSPRKVTKLVDGVYAIEHRVSSDGMNSGNTAVIIGDRQVFVVDTCFVPSHAKEDIAQIRTWTDKPVAFVLNTHFHNDHTIGNRAYMDAFPGLSIIAHSETKKDMDLFAESDDRGQQTNVVLTKMLDSGKGRDGHALTAQEKEQVKGMLASRTPLVEENMNLKFQTATFTFDRDFTIDLGNREVQVKFLGRGNTPGDAVVYLPKEKIAIVGDLVVFPVPYIYDGYPSEWVRTLDNLVSLGPTTIFPGHGPVMHDTKYVSLVQDLLKSAVQQWNAKITQLGPGMFRTLDEAKAAIDLRAFKPRFAGNDKDLAAEFDGMAADLIKVVFREASLR